MLLKCSKADTGVRRADIRNLETADDLRFSHTTAALWLGMPFDWSEETGQTVLL